jgi:hypothetical protein
MMDAADPRPQRQLGMRLRVTIYLAAVLCYGTFAIGCPFCTAIAPSLAQVRETADVVALGEVNDAKLQPARFKLHRVAAGEDLLVDRDWLDTDVNLQVKPGELVLLFGTKQDDALKWIVVVVNETSAAYFFRAPSLRIAEPERLKYFASFLEHPDPTISEDAYREFGHARFESVSKVVDQIPNRRVQEWLLSDGVPQARKGFFGLVLGLAKTTEERRANIELLHKLIVDDDDDFRAGFDGVLGGYLLLTGEDGLKLIEDRILANPQSRVGDVYHAMTALRFYHEYGKEIPVERLRAALGRLLVRPEFAQPAITDLARWQGWEFCDRIADLYTKPGYGASEIRRAIVGYLRACPLPAAAKHLARLRTLDPTGIAQAEEVLRKVGGLSEK